MLRADVVSIQKLSRQVLNGRFRFSHAKWNCEVKGVERKRRIAFVAYERGCYNNAGAGVSSPLR